MTSSGSSDIQKFVQDALNGKIGRRDVLKKGAALGLSATALGLLLAACGGGAATGTPTAGGGTSTPAATSTATSGGGSATASATATTGATTSGRGNDTFIVAVVGDIDTFDPAFTVGSKPSQTTIQNTFDQLTQYQVVDKKLADGTPYKAVDTAQIIGMMSQSWEYGGTNNADMIFHLRDGLTFANGDPIDATVILEGYKRIYEAKGIAATLLSMGGSVKDASSFEAPDAKTFIIHMSKPNGLTAKCNVMHNEAILDPAEIKAHATASDVWATDYFKKTLGVGNGPYKLDSYKPGDSINLVRNDTYYLEKAKFNKVIMKIVPDASQRVLLIKSGDVDMIDVAPYKDLEGLKSDANIKVVSIPSTRNFYAGMNNTIPPFDKKEVRQAVSYAIPYKDLITQVMRGYAQESKSLVGAGMPTSDFSTWKYDTNPEKAKELLAAAGYPNGNGMPSVKLSVRIGAEEDGRTAILIQNALKNIGMNVQIENAAFAAFNEQEQGGKLQFFVDEWISWVNDPYYHMSWLASSKSPTNYVHYKNDRVDQIVDQFTLSPEGPDRDAASKEAQALIIEDAPYAFLYQPDFVVVTRADIDGYIYYNDQLTRFAPLFRKA
ncbi:MAG: ABC transporter substrate-binding protein [Candidatus Marsarchaeota archaeon]|nr:ABC transporter substrate-binding protein [Candidatus Marsarchaeota archaeon]